MSTVIYPDKCGVCGAEMDTAYTAEEADAMKVMASVPPVQLIEGNFSRIRVRAQDVIVITAKGKVSDQLRQVILDQLRPMFPGNKILVLDEGFQIGVMAPVRDEDCEQDEDDGA